MPPGGCLPNRGAQDRKCVGRGAYRDAWEEYGRQRQIVGEEDAAFGTVELKAQEGGLLLQDGKKLVQG